MLSGWSCPMTDPLIHPGLFVSYLVLVLATGFIIVTRRTGRWEEEKKRVRRTVLHRLGLAEGETADLMVLDLLLALVPCRVKTAAGRSAIMGGERRMWLFFLSDRLLMISSATGYAVELTRADYRRLYLV